VTDILSILEQAVAARSAFFVGHAVSSVSGGVVNMRGRLGMSSELVSFDDGWAN